MDLAELMASEEFKEQCDQKFDSLDEDKNGVLTVEELFPVIEEISADVAMAQSITDRKSVV